VAPPLPPARTGAYPRPTMAATTMFSGTAPSRARSLGEGMVGAGVMALALATPFLRARRNRWGWDSARAGVPRPGDDLIPCPDWTWTHAIRVDAPAQDVWPWIAQIGADRGGFYSYSALENLVGCGVRNADRIHPEWQARAGDGLLLHPRAPAIPIVEVVPGRHLVAHAPADEDARAAGRPWTAVSWLIAVEPLHGGRSRAISRYRCAHSGDLRTRLGFGPGLLEPIGFAMDRRMLIGIRDRAEGRAG
jgi:hypothetical protein